MAKKVDQYEQVFKNYPSSAIFTAPSHKATVKIAISFANGRKNIALKASALTADYTNALGDRNIWSVEVNLPSSLPMAKMAQNQRLLSMPISLEEQKLNIDLHAKNTSFFIEYRENNQWQKALVRIQLEVSKKIFDINSECADLVDFKIRRFYWSHQQALSISCFFDDDGNLDLNFSSSLAFSAKHLHPYLSQKTQETKRLELKYYPSGRYGIWQKDKALDFLLHTADENESPVYQLKLRPKNAGKNRRHMLTPSLFTQTVNYQEDNDPSFKQESSGFKLALEGLLTEKLFFYQLEASYDPLVIETTDAAKEISILDSAFHVGFSRAYARLFKELQWKLGWQYMSMFATRGEFGIKKMLGPSLGSKVLLSLFPKLEAHGEARITKILPTDRHWSYSDHLLSGSLTLQYTWHQRSSIDFNFLYQKMQFQTDQRVAAMEILRGSLGLNYVF